MHLWKDGIVYHINATRRLLAPKTTSLVQFPSNDIFDTGNLRASPLALGFCVLSFFSKLFFAFTTPTFYFCIHFFLTEVSYTVEYKNLKITSSWFSAIYSHLITIHVKIWNACGTSEGFLVPPQLMICFFPQRQIFLLSPYICVSGSVCWQYWGFELGLTFTRQASYYLSHSTSSMSFLNLMYKNSQNMDSCVWLLLSNILYDVSSPV